MKVYSLTERKLINSITGTIYEMAPGHHVRYVGRIINGIKQWCKLNIGEKYLIRVEADNVYKTIKDILMSIEAFTQLNISQRLWDI